MTKNRSPAQHWAKLHELIQKVLDTGAEDIYYDPSFDSDLGGITSKVHMRGRPSDAIIDVEAHQEALEELGWLTSRSRILLAGGDVGDEEKIS